MNNENNVVNNNKITYNKDVSRCLYCNRKLKNPAAINRGYGLTCYKKYIYNISNKTRKLF